MNNLLKILVFVFCFFSFVFANDSVLQKQKFKNKILEKVSLQLSWKHQFEFAGFYIAKEKGFYKDIGLDVSFKEYQFGINLADEILSGKSNFGVGKSSLIVDKIAYNKDILLLAAIFQNSPLILHSKKRPDIKILTDIKDKKIMISPHNIIMAPINAMLISNNLENKYKKIPHSFDVNDIISQKTDLMTSYLSNQPFFLKEKGLESTVFNPKDYGFDFYDNILFTSLQFEKDNPELVNKFYKASLKGWKYAFSHIDETVNLILNKYNTQNKSKKALLYEAKIFKKLALLDDVQFGNINVHKVNNIVNTYAFLNIIKSTQIDLHEIVYNSNEQLKNDFIQNNLDYKLALKVLFVIFIILLILIFKQYFLERQNKILEKLVDKKTQELKDINKNLQEKIKEEVEKNRQKELQLFEQSKMAAMGEMIGNIAHQWRQPLNIVSTVASGIKTKQQFGINIIDELPKGMDTIIEKTKYLSEIIDTFRNFLMEKKEIKKVIIQDRIDIALNIINVALKDNGIDLRNNINYDKPIKITMIIGELSEVLINIINNAKDILLERKVENPWIKLNLNETSGKTIQEKKVVISIEDNGGGISKDVFSKIFNPYFTTKHQSQGTGLGLHMSYQIVVESLKGKLYVENTKNGAKFFIELPVDYENIKFKEKKDKK